MKRERITYSHDVIFDETNFSKNPSACLSSGSRDFLSEDFELDPISIIESSTNPTVEASSLDEISSPTDDTGSGPRPNNPSCPPQEALAPFNRSISPVLPDPPPLLGKRKTFWSYKPTTPVPSQEVSSSIDSRNIIKRRTRGANAALSSDSPWTFKQAMKSPSREQRLDAVAIALENMARQNVWTVVDFPSNARAVGTVWVFKTKMKPDGTILKFKACLCAQGFSQIAGVDFN